LIAPGIEKSIGADKQSTGTQLPEPRKGRIDFLFTASSQDV
jgi:hypothetical protein